MNPNMRFECVRCGRAISPKEGHAVCKPCRPSNRRYETSGRRRFRKAVYDFARYSGAQPNFSNFETRFAMWLEADRRTKELRAVIDYARAILKSLPSRTKTRQRVAHVAPAAVKTKGRAA
jgi:hypothetical protein